jgi:hypothetical protein
MRRARRRARVAWREIALQVVVLVLVLGALLARLSESAQIAAPLWATRRLPPPESLGSGDTVFRNAAAPPDPEPEIPPELRPLRLAQRSFTNASGGAATGRPPDGLALDELAHDDLAPNHLAPNHLVGP